MELVKTAFITTATATYSVLVCKTVIHKIECYVAVGQSDESAAIKTLANDPAYALVQLRALLGNNAQVHTLD